MATVDTFSLPRGWTKTTRSSVLHAISLAFMAVTRSWASSATSRRRTIRLAALGSLPRVLTPNRCGSVT